MSRSKEILHMVQVSALSVETLKWGDASLSNDDIHRLGYALALWVLLQVDIVKPRARRDVSLAAVKSYLQRLLASDIEELFNVLDKLLMLLREVNPLETKACAVKRMAKERDLQLSDWRLSLMREPIHAFLKGEVDLFQQLNDFLQFMKRVTLKDREDLQQQTVEKYLQEEQDLPEEYPSELIQELKRELSTFKLDLDHFRPRHSNGATTEVARGAGKQLKYKRAQLDPGTKFLANRLCLGNLSDTMLSREMNPSRGQTVPKGIDKRRFIGIEPSARMYLQNGLRACFDNWFKKHPEWGIDLHDQSKNQLLALEGNITGDYGTVDITSASDSVVWAFLKKTLRASVVLHLGACRSGYVVMPGDMRKIKIRKYAGMGNSTTFPVECLVFAAVVRVARRHVGTRSHYVVYGDDIVVHRDCFDEVVRLLGVLGFKVNYDKTYSPSAYFHESCGLEAYLGSEVTPIRLSRKWDPLEFEQRDPEQIASFAKLANVAYGRGYTLTRRLLVEQIMQVCPAYPFGSNEGELLSNSRDLNVHLLHRWNSGLQRYEQKQFVVHSRVSLGYDDYRYLAYWDSVVPEREVLSSPEDLCNPRVGRVTTVGRLEWRDANLEQTDMLRWKWAKARAERPAKLDRTKRRKRG